MVLFDLEHLEDVDVNEGNLVTGGESPPPFQLVLGGTSATTGAAAGGRVQNSTSSTFTLNGGLGNPNLNVLLTATANSFSLPF